MLDQAKVLILPVRKVLATFFCNIKLSGTHVRCQDIMARSSPASTHHYFNKPGHFGCWTGKDHPRSERPCQLVLQELTCGVLLDAIHWRQNLLKNCPETPRAERIFKSPGLKWEQFSSFSESVTGHFILFIRYILAIKSLQKGILRQICIG